MKAAPAGSAPHPGQPGLAERVDAALVDLRAIRSTDPAATRALHAVRLAAQTVERHVVPLTESDDR